MKLTKLIGILCLAVGMALPAPAALSQTSIQLRSWSCTTTTPAVTNASTTILAANGLRRYFHVQNNHATATININFTAAATTAHTKIYALGGMYRQDTATSPQDITAIGSVASNTDVVVVSCQ